MIKIYVIQDMEQGALDVAIGEKELQDRLDKATFKSWCQWFHAKGPLNLVSVALLESPSMGTQTANALRSLAKSDFDSACELAATETIRAAKARDPRCREHMYVEAVAVRSLTAHELLLLLSDVPATESGRKKRRKR